MNKKGFTLIELIVTIALLAVIAVVSFISITNVIKENYNKECKNIETSLKNAAKSYISDNRYSQNNWNCDGVEGSDVEVSAQYLLDNSYLTKEITDPYTGKVVDNLDEWIVKVDLDKSCRPFTISVEVEEEPINCQR